MHSVVTTHAGKHIDIIIDSDYHLIAIENKLFHWLANPLDDYASYLSKRAQGKTLYKILLVLHPQEETKLEGFVPLLYSNYITQVRCLLGSYARSPDSRYLLLLLDLLTTLENLKKGTTMNAELLKLFRERDEDIRRFYRSERIQKGIERQG